eukprot:1187314-Prorocentrum_minimum.AAC.1
MFLSRASAVDLRGGADQRDAVRLTPYYPPKPPSLRPPRFAEPAAGADLRGGADQRDAVRPCLRPAGAVGPRLVHWGRGGGRRPLQRLWDRRNPPGQGVLRGGPDGGRDGRH